MKEGFDALFSMKKACSNCPFKVKGAIGLMPGRLAGIAQSLLADDFQTFLCHKSVHSVRGGVWDEDEDGGYKASGKEAHCFGAMVALFKAGRPSVGMRVAIMQGRISIAELQSAAALFVDAKDASEGGCEEGGLDDEGL